MNVAMSLACIGCAKLPSEMGTPASVAAAPSSLLLCAAGLVSFRLVLARRRGSSSAPVAAAPPPEGSRRGEAGWPDSVVHGNALASRSTSKRVPRHWWEHYLVLAFEFMCGNGIRRGEPGLSRDRSLSICSPLVALASSVR